VLSFISGELLATIVFFAQLIVGALTWACIVGLVYSGFECAFPRQLVHRDSVRYQVGPLTIGLVIVGVIGLAIAGLWWMASTNTAARDATDLLAAVFWVSSMIFDVGAFMWLTSEARPA
jgi:cytochrome bd-type quinol oxidase subunit 2